MELAESRAEWSVEDLELAEQHHPGRKGTKSTYDKQGCRCPECRAAKAASRSSSGSGSRSSSSGKKGRRADKVAETIRDGIRLRRPDLDTEELTLLEVIDRDALAWGELVAWAAEFFTPLGLLIDAVFGAPLAVLVKIAPTIRAARRDLRRRRLERQAQRELEELEAERNGAGGPPVAEGLPTVPGLGEPGGYEGPS